MLDIRLTQNQRSALKHIAQQAGWEQMLEVKNKVVDLWSQESVKAEDQFNTVWNTAQKEAKIRGLEDFFNILENEVSK